MNFYSPSTGGFYIERIHGEHMPGDVIKITVEQHAALLAGANAGQRIVVNAGVPVLADALPPPDEVLAAHARRTRARLLKDSDWTELPSVQALHTAAAADAWTQYRQALRDVTAQAGFPASIDWPQAPDHNS